MKIHTKGQSDLTERLRPRVRSTLQRKLKTISKNRDFGSSDEEDETDKVIKKLEKKLDKNKSKLSKL